MNILVLKARVDNHPSSVHDAHNREGKLILHQCTELMDRVCPQVLEVMSKYLASKVVFERRSNTKALFYCQANPTIQLLFDLSLIFERSGNLLHVKWSKGNTMPNPNRDRSSHERPKFNPDTFVKPVLKAKSPESRLSSFVGVKTSELDTEHLQTIHIVNEKHHWALSNGVIAFVGLHHTQAKKLNGCSLDEILSHFGI